MERRMKHIKGFSLLELLIVVAIILVIAAIAIPSLLQARISANEASAVGSLNAIKTAEFTYFNTYPTVGYAVQLADLGGTQPCTPGPVAACLVDDVVATAGPGSVGKGGYVFRAIGFASGSAINSTFVSGGAPLTVNKTGNRDFCSTSDGILRSQMSAAGSQPVNTVAACLGFPVSQ
jgi:type IV pilus assembly protein PilA